MFRSYQTILREMSCLVVKLLKVARFCAPFGYVAACIWIRLCAPFVVDVSVARTVVLATDTSRTKEAHKLIQMHAAT